jgi:drug/metabolite transporter (DMT)-like permease
MEQLDEQPENFRASDPQAAEALLRSMTQDIENLRQNLLVQLSQDVERLHREKSQLVEDIDKLQAQRQQQIVQQQKLLRQIAPALANQLQELLKQQLNQLAAPSQVSDQDATLLGNSVSEATSEEQGVREGQNPRQTPVGRAAGSGSPPDSAASDYNENAYRLIASLDSTLRATFRTLEQDLSSYQSSLSQQLGQMYSLEQQGEAILETLVSRLRKEIQSESSAIKPTPQAPPPAPTHPPLPRQGGYPQNNHHTSVVSYPSEQSMPVVPLIPEPEPPVAIPQPPTQSQQSSKLLLGFLLVLLSLLVLSFQNVIITLILNKSPVFGLFEQGGFISPGLGNSLLILWLRMLVVVPLMAILATVLYPQVWRDIQQFAQSKDWFLFIRVVGSGFFLFLSQVLIYLALGSISPGVAITIFFIYPVLTVLLGWVLFGVRLNLSRSIVIFSVLVGVVLIALPSSRAGDFSGMGVRSAAGSAIAFAFYVILAQTCAKKLNPVPLSWINFVLILSFSSFSLAGPFPESWRFDVAPNMWPSLLLSSLVLGGTTLVSYLLDNISIRMISAARASILGATVPALTALLAWVIIQSTLQLQQIFGMLLVTLGVTFLSVERLRRAANKTTQPTARKRN